MYILSDFAQENKEQKKQPNYLVPALVVGGLGLGALAALRMGSKKSLEAVKKETQQQLEDFQKRVPLKRNVPDKEYNDLIKQLKKESQGKGATGYDKLPTKEQKSARITSRKALIKEVALQNQPLGKSGIKLEPPDPNTGLYYMLNKNSSSLPEGTRQRLNRLSANANKLNVLRAQELARSRGLEYRHGSVTDFASK